MTNAAFDRIRHWFPEMEDGFPPEFAPAFRGVVMRLDKVIPAYELYDTLGCFTSGDSWTKLSHLMADFSGVVLYKPDRSLFWHRVRQGNLVAFEHLVHAISYLGTSKLWDNNYVVYDYNTTLATLEESLEDSTTTDAAFVRNLATRYFERNLRGVDFGFASPGFLFKFDGLNLT